MTERFAIDPERSTVRFEVQSSVHAITAETTGVTGHFSGTVLPGGAIDLSTPPTAEIVVPVAELSAGNPLYDREMRRRAGLRRNPTVTATLTGVRAAGDGAYVASGSIQFRDATVEAEDRITVTVAGDDTITVEGSHTFDVRDFGIAPPSLLLLKVSPDVTVTMSLLATRAPPGRGER